MNLLSFRDSPVRGIDKQWSYRPLTKHSTIHVIYQDFIIGYGRLSSVIRLFFPNIPDRAAGLHKLCPVFMMAFLLPSDLVFTNEPD
jgi:hypothetical protein